MPVMLVVPMPMALTLVALVALVALTPVALVALTLVVLLLVDVLNSRHRPASTVSAGHPPSSGHPPVLARSLQIRARRGNERVTNTHIFRAKRPPRRPP